MKALLVSERTFTGKKFQNKILWKFSRRFASLDPQDVHLHPTGSSLIQRTSPEESIVWSSHKPSPCSIDFAVSAAHASVHADLSTLGREVYYRLIAIVFKSMETLFIASPLLRLVANPISNSTTKVTHHGESYRNL